MKSDVVQLAFVLIVLSVGAGAEELLPKFLGVGFPVLLTAAQYAATRRTAVLALLFAGTAGAVEDALSSLPFAMSASYFVGVAALARWSRLPRAAMALTYPLYQFWLWLWVPDLCGSVFIRMLAAVPAGLVTAVAGVALLAWGERGAAIDEG